MTSVASRATAMARLREKVDGMLFSRNASISYFFNPIKGEERDRPLTLAPYPFRV